MAALATEECFSIVETNTTNDNTVSSNDRKNTVTAFRGVWQAKVGTIQEQLSGSDSAIIKRSDNTNNNSNSNPSLLTAAPITTECNTEHEMITATVSSPTVFQLDLSSEEISDRKSATSQIKLTAGSIWQTLSPWKRRHNKIAPSPQQHSSILKHSNHHTTTSSNTSKKSFCSEAEKENTSSSPHVVTLQNGKSFIDDSYHSLEQENKDNISPKYTKINKQQRRAPPPPPPPPPLPSLPSSLQRQTTQTNVRYIETSPIKDYSNNEDEATTTTNQIIRVLSLSPLSEDQDSLYESLKDENEEHYSEVGIHGNQGEIPDLHSNEAGIQLLSIKGHIPDSITEEGLLIEEGGDSTGMLPIHYAAAKGNKKELKGILSLLPIIQDPVERVLGSDKFCTRKGIDVRDNEGRTPLMHAVHYNHLKCVKLLSHFGASINIEATDGSTCLHQAAYSGSVEMIGLLLSLGANGMEKDNEGRLPIHWCMNNSNPDCAKLLLEKVPGLSPDITDSSHMTPLMWAGYYGRSENVELLKQKGADSKLVDIEGMTAIHWSTKSHDIKTLQLLLNTESSCYKDEKGRSVIHYAAKEGFPKAVSVIKGTSPLCVDEQDNNGRSALHWAAVCEKPDVIRALLSVGADPNITDSQGYTALDYAVQKHLPYCSLLLAQGQSEQTAADGVLQ